jgi:transcriptional regulator with XRE-family HTH domain
MRRKNTGEAAMTPFAQVLHRERKRLYMSQAELASLLGVHQQTVSEWENGRLLIDEAQKQLLVHVFGPDSELALNINNIDFDTPSCEPRGRRIRGKLRRGAAWVPLTLDDMDTLEISKEWLAGARWAEAKLREKNR